MMRAAVGFAVLFALQASPIQAACESPFPNLHFTTLPSLAVDTGDGVYDGPGLQAFALADLNGDDRLDLVVVEADDDRVEVWLGRADGSGMFDYLERFDTELSTPTAVIVADVASPFGSDDVGKPDGKPDLIVGGLFDVDILLGRGDGQFDPPEQQIEENFDLGFVAGLVADEFDAQRGTDLAVLDDDGMVTFMCNGAGNLQPCDVAPIELPDYSEPIDNFAVDFNGDGDRDVAVLDRDEASVTPIFGNGDGTFAVAERISVRGEGETSSDLAVGRLDGDLLDDLAVVNHDEFNLYLGVTLFGRRDRGFTASLFVAEFNSNALALADFSDPPDGLSDGVVGGERASGPGVQLNDGLGHLQDPFLPSYSGRLPSVAVLAAGEIGGDTQSDLVVLDTEGRTMQVAINDTAFPPPCAGDCNCSGDVSVNELLTAVGIALREPAQISCRPADVDFSGRVTISELIAAVRAALDGCPR